MTENVAPEAWFLDILDKREQSLARLCIIRQSPLFKSNKEDDASKEKEVTSDEQNVDVRNENDETSSTYYQMIRRQHHAIWKTSCVF